MKYKALTLTAVIAAVALAGVALTNPSIAHGPGAGPYQGGAYQGQQMGPGMMGGGHMGPGMMGGGHMGYGQGHGMMGGHMGYGQGFGAQGDCPAAQAAQGKEVTVDGVTVFLERRLSMWGNDRLKLGTVAEEGESKITGEIVTQDGSLVEKFAFDKNTGRMTRAQ